MLVLADVDFAVFERFSVYVNGISYLVFFVIEYIERIMKRVISDGMRNIINGGWTWEKGIR